MQQPKKINNQPCVDYQKKIATSILRSLMQHPISNPSQIQKVPNKLTLLDVQTSQPTHFN